MTGRSSSVFLIGLFVIFAIPAQTNAQDEPPAAPPAEGGGAAGDKIVLDAPTTPSPEEIEIDEAIKELKIIQCKLVYGNCWMAYSNDKPYFSEEKRIRLCLKRTQGFSVCESMTEEHAKEARDEAEEKMQRAKEEEEEKRLAAEEEEKAAAAKSTEAPDDAEGGGGAAAA